MQNAWLQQNNVGATAVGQSTYEELLSEEVLETMCIDRCMRLCWYAAKG